MRSSINIFEYQSYRQYLKNRLEAAGPKSGLKRQAAEALSVHTTFISQVVLEKAELSLDQAERMNLFLNHNSEEGDFFIDLVILERASEPQLKKRFEKKIKNKYVEQVQIETRLHQPKEVDAIEREKFYSSYIYGLLHVLCSIPKLQTREALAEASGFPLAQVDHALDFLIRIGILKKEKNKIVPGEKNIHLKKKSKEILNHHTNWRLATLQQMTFGDESDLHYSLAFTCSKSDAIKIRETILKNLSSMSETISKSKEEEAYIYCFDFFKWA